MKWSVLIVCCVELALSLPQGYNYKEPAPGIVDSNLGGFQPIQAPCNHGPVAAALVQQQSIGRILNKQQGAQGVLVAGGGLDSQAVTVNSHIVVGDGGHSQTFREGHGYAEQNRLPPVQIPLPGLTQGPPLSGPGPVQSFVQTSQQQFGSNHDSFASSNSFSTANNRGAIVHGIGKLAPPPPALNGGYQYANGFGGGKFSSGPGFGGPNRGPAFLGAPVNPNFISGPRPIGGGQKFIGTGFQGSGSKFQNVGGFQGNVGGFQSNGGAAHFQGGQAGGFIQQQSGGFSHGSGSQSIGIGGSSFGGNALLNGDLGNVIRETFANAPLDPTVEKHIYVHVPPEDLEENEIRQHIRLPEVPAKKHYKIIFIKAPTVGAQTNYAQFANAAGASEEKTIVYVLVKKPEEPSVHEIQQVQQTIKPSKPEVYFIKYKTKKEEGPGFIGGGYNANIDQSGGNQQIDGIGSGQFAGSDLDGGLDIRLEGGGSGVDSFQTGTSGSFASSSSSSSSSGNSVNLNIGEGGAQHAVYGVPNVK